jgi:hypothetical protein
MPPLSSFQLEQVVGWFNPTNKCLCLNQTPSTCTAARFMVASASQMFVLEIHPALTKNSILQVYDSSHKVTLQLLDHLYWMQNYDAIYTVNQCKPPCFFGCRIIYIVYTGWRRPIYLVASRIHLQLESSTTRLY